MIPAPECKLSFPPQCTCIINIRDYMRGYRCQAIWASLLTSQGHLLQLVLEPPFFLLQEIQQALHLLVLLPGVGQLVPHAVFIVLVLQ